MMKRSPEAIMDGINPDFLKSCIGQHLKGIPRLNKLDEYYRGIHKIQLMQKSGKYASNNRLVNSYPKYISDTVCGYMFGNSITYTYAEAEGEDIIGEVGTNVDYAAFVEFSTGPVGKASPKMLPDGVDVSYSPKGWAYRDDDGFKYTKGQPAQPFLYPAFKQNESSVPDIIASTIKQELAGGKN